MCYIYFDGLFKTCNVLRDYTYRLLISRVDLIDLSYLLTTFENWLFYQQVAVC